MPFPITPILSTLAGADENPLSEGGDWASSAWWVNDLQRLSNAAQDVPPDQFAGMRWTPDQFPTDFETYLTVEALPTMVGDGVFIDLFTAADPASPDGYDVAFTKGASGWDLVAKLVAAGGGFTFIDGINVPSFTAGDAIGVRRINGIWSFYMRLSGTWTLVHVGTTVDTTYAGPLFPQIAVEEDIGGTPAGTIRVSNFGGGSLVAPSNQFPQLPILDTFNRANETPIGPPWASSTAWWGTGANLTSNALAPNGVSGSVYEAATFGPDVAVRWDVPVIPPNNGDYISIDLFLQNTEVSATPDGYSVRLARSGSGTLHILIQKWTAGVLVNELDFDPISFSNGNDLGIVRSGDNLYVYRLQASTITLLATMVDGEYTGPFYITGAFDDTAGAGSNAVRLNDFRAGNIVANWDPTTATVIASVPDTLTQDVVVNGTANEVWYQWTATYTGVLGVWAYGDFSTYNPTISVYTGASAESVTPYLNLSNGGSFVGWPIQVPVDIGTTYYFRITPNGNPATADLTLDLLPAPLDANVPETIIINDDTEGFPAAFIHPLTGAILRFKHPMIAGESGDGLPDGSRFLFSDDFNDELWLFDAELTPLLEIGVGTFIDAIRTSNAQNVFYIAYSPTTATLIGIVSSTGVFTPNVANLGSVTVFGMAANNDGTILYYTRRSVDSAIKRWNITTNTAMSDLAPADGSTAVQDLLVLADDTIIAPYTSGSAVTVRHYSPTGTLLHTYGPYPTLLESGTLSRADYASDDPLSFWLWTHERFPNNGISTFRKIVVSSGTVEQLTSLREYETGVYNDPVNPASLAISARFGNSFSCPLVIVRTGSTPPPVTSGCPDPLGVQPADITGCASTLGPSAV